MLGITFTATVVKSWFTPKDLAKQQPTALVDILWIVNTTSDAPPKLLFHNNAGAKAPSIRFSAAGGYAYFRSSDALFVVRLSTGQEVGEFRGAIGPFYIDRLQNLYFAKKDLDNV